MQGEVVWAVQNPPEIYDHLWQHFGRFPGCQPHWSRSFEYPWVVLHGNFQPGQKVLDAGGGKGPLQHYLADRGCRVINADADVEDSHHAFTYGAGTLRQIQVDLGSFCSPGAFDRIACVSVLEHTADPATVLENLWASLKPGGRLIVTLDVAGYSRWNHTLDLCGASNLLGRFVLLLPSEPEDIAHAYFQEIQRSKWEPEGVWLRVLCFYIDKPE